MMKTFLLHAALRLFPAHSYAPAETPSEFTARLTSIASDLFSVLNDRPALMPDDPEKIKTAALFWAIASYESGFAKSVDEGRIIGSSNSWCLMQINLGGPEARVYFGPPAMRLWSARDLVRDRKKCFAAAYEVLRISMETCKHKSVDERLSVYVGTGNKCVSSAASKARWARSKKIAGWWTGE